MKILEAAYRGNILLISIVLLPLLGYYGCCDIRFTSYDFEVNFTLEENIIPVNTPFDLVITIPENAVSREGASHDMSDLDFEFTLECYSYSNDTTLNYREFDNGLTSFNVEAEDIENNETFIFGRPVNTEAGREMRFQITPTAKDTFILTVTTRGDGDVRGTCVRDHYFNLQNNQLSLENSGFNIRDTVSGLNGLELTHGMLVLIVE